MKHFDRAGCERRGWKLPYFDYVTNLQLVVTGLDELARSAYFSQQALHLLVGLLEPKSSIHHMWCLALLRVRLEDREYFHEERTDLLEELAKSPSIPDILVAVKRNLRREESESTYWQDTVAIIEASLEEKR